MMLDESDDTDDADNVDTRLLGYTEQAKIDLCLA